MVYMGYKVKDTNKIIQATGNFQKFDQFFNQ
jgi:hypothetical protein